MSVLDWARRRNKIAFGEIELQVCKNFDIQIRLVDRLDFKCLSWSERDNNLRRGEWQLLKFRLDDVRPRGTECRGSFARGDQHLNWRISLSDENVDCTVVFDLEASYAVHSCVREQLVRQMSAYVNAQAICGYCDHDMKVRIIGILTSTKMTYVFAGE